MQARPLWLILLLVTFTVSTVLPHAFSQPELVINVRTEKSAYRYRQLVSIYGNVTFGGAPVEEGLVAIQLEDPENTTLALRTVPANSTPVESWTVEITSFMATDSSGNPKTTFGKNGFAYFKASIKNNNIFSNKTVLLTITLYDSDLTPIRFHYLITTINPQATLTELVGLYIDDWVSPGNATAYACIYTNWPKNGGYPYAPEKQAAFRIVRASSTAPQIPEHEASSYQTAIRLPPSAQLGTYRITVSAYYQGNKDSFNEATFIREYHVLGDVIYNRKIDIYDVVSVSLAYGTQGGDLGWNPEVDLAPNGVIDIFDVVVVTGKYGETY